MNRLPLRKSLLLAAAIPIAGGLAGTPAQALFGLRWFSSSATPELQKSHSMVEGQKVKVFKLRLAKASDLQPAVENRLKVIKSNGFVTVDEGKNELVLTDFPETLQQFEVLIRAIDQAYDNPNAASRRMLAGEQMLKAVRSMNLGNQPVRTAGTSAGASASPPPASASAILVGSPGAATATPGPAWTPTPVRSDREDEQQSLRWVADETPTLGSFKILGWMNDGRRLIVALRNGPQRYFLYQGRLHVGRVTSTVYLKDFEASVSGDHLTIRHRDQGVLILPMIPKRDKDGGVR